MRAGWLVLSLATFTLAAATPLACGGPFVLDQVAAGSSSSTGMGGTAASGAASSGGGNGGSASCEQDSDCTGPNGGCVHQRCENKVCVTRLVPANEKSTSQVYGDCHIVKCDGAGKALPPEIDATDTYNDANTCTSDTCKDGKPTQEVTAGNSCSLPGSKTLCTPSGACVQCLDNTDCTDPLICVQSKCVPVTCTNAKKDNDETDVDCGGATCVPCEDGKSCTLTRDCKSNGCAGMVNGKKCLVTSCADSALNGTETDIDCGGPACVTLGALCQDTQKCVLPTDCASKVCKAGLCEAPSCTDGVDNGEETDVDCGGPCGPCN